MIDNKNIESCNALFSAAGCVCFHNNEFLLLKRTDDKSYPNLWGVPTGKIEQGETAIQTIIRELYEETEILLSADRLKLVDTFCVTTEDMSFKYTLYFVNFDIIPTVKINPFEHKEYTWIHYDMIDSLELVPDAEETILYAIRERNTKPFAQLNLFTNEADIVSKPNLKLNEYLSKFSGLEKRFEFTKKWVVTFGSPGTGKTTTLKRIQRKICPSFLISDNKQILSEGTRLNNYLVEATKHKKWLYYFFFQMEILPERFRQSFNAPDNSFIDESIFSTLAYSTALYRLRWLRKYEFETFLVNYQFYCHFLPNPTLILYFYCSTETMIMRKEKRLEKVRNREIEKHYSYQYLEALNSGFKEVAEQLKNAGYEIVFIDTDGKSIEEVTNETLKKIGRLWT